MDRRWSADGNSSPLAIVAIGLGLGVLLLRFAYPTSLIPAIRAILDLRPPKASSRTATHEGCRSSMTGLTGADAKKAARLILPAKAEQRTPARAVRGSLVRLAARARCWSKISLVNRLPVVICAALVALLCSFVGCEAGQVGPLGHFQGWLQRGWRRGRQGSRAKP